MNRPPRNPLRYISTHTKRPPNFPTTENLLLRHFIPLAYYYCYICPRTVPFYYCDTSPICYVQVNDVYPGLLLILMSL
jgi:hypothetical protein